MKSFRLAIYLLIIILAVFSGYVSGQNVVINEVMSENASNKQDEDMDYSDWIELFNPGTSRMILNEYYLSDQKDSLKWQIPNTALEPGEFLLIFASGKNRSKFTTWRTVIEWGDIWKYFEGISEPDSNWKTLEFNDANWKEGPTCIGFGNSNDSTKLPIINSLYVRKIFHVKDINSVEDMKLLLDYDDGYVAYLNGQEVARDNLGKPGEKIFFNTKASWNREAYLYRGQLPKVISLKNSIQYLNNGENVLSIQVHNSPALSDTDLACIPVFYLGYKNGDNADGRPVSLRFRDTIITKSAHTNFKLDSGGEKLYLYNSIGNRIDYLNIPELLVNSSYGRSPDGRNNLYILPNATPGYANGLQNAVSTDIAPPLFSVPAGFYKDSVVVSITNKDPNVKIYYTIDNTDPLNTSPSSILYTTPIIIKRTQVIKARAFSLSNCSKEISTNTYLINENTTLPVVSLSSNPINFWGAKTGIISNISEDWEKPIHVEFFETDKTLAFSINGGTRITGNGSRVFPQNSFVIFARDIYGNNKIDYQVFPDKPIKQFEAILLRNGGNDWLKALFRDGFMQEIAKGTNVDLQAYRPAIVFINGTYWGIYEVRERLNEDYVAENYHIDRDSVYIIKPEYQQGWLYDGRENQVYSDLQDFVETHDLRDSVNYNYVLSQIDVDNFIDYNAAEIYYNNYDWPILNTRLWRPIKPGGRWRWILCDLDFGFGYDFFERNAHEYNDDMLGSLLSANTFNNPPRSSNLFRGLVKNDKFRNAFITRFADLLNTNFTPQAVTPIITRFKSAIEKEIPRHQVKWPMSAQNWNSKVNVLYEFADKRIPNVYMSIITHFGLEGLYDLSIDLPMQGEGFIKVNTVELKELPWKGVYFRNLPIELTAIPKPGYLFAGWNNEISGMTNPIKIMTKENFKISAKFVKSSIPEKSIVINEINYKSNEAMNSEDWIELYNSSDSTVNLYGCNLSDSDSTHNYEIPPNSVIAPKGYLVICRDKNAFSSIFPNQKHVVGNFSFGLDNKGEKIILRDPNKIILDSLTYNNKGEWPAEADGEGYTLELKNSKLDNSLAHSWAISKVKGGTPGEINSVSEPDIISYPKEITLFQNYPNPFNSGTLIRYSIPEAGELSLAVFDILGQKLFEDRKVQKEPGYGEFRLKGEILNKLSSGVYFYRLQFKNHAETKKMVLLR
ncbi:MAG: CotH kinase family protein [Bacteroidota bacterium]|nr:CotH kinase family protein [Bacteroidota bacterium]